MNETQNTDTLKSFLNWLADTPRGKEEFNKSIKDNATALCFVVGCGPLSELALMYYAFIGGMNAGKKNNTTV